MQRVKACHSPDVSVIIRVQYSKASLSILNITYCCGSDNKHIISIYLSICQHCTKPQHKHVSMVSTRWRQRRVPAMKHATACTVIISSCSQFLLCLISHRQGNHSWHQANIDLHAVLFNQASPLVASRVLLAGMPASQTGPTVTGTMEGWPRTLITVQFRIFWQLKKSKSVETSMFAARIDRSLRRPHHSNTMQHTLQ